MQCEEAQSRFADVPHGLRQCDGDAGYVSNSEIDPRIPDWRRDRAEGMIGILFTTAPDGFAGTAASFHRLLDHRIWSNGMIQSGFGLGSSLTYN
jgi:hypothetical protein